MSAERGDSVTRNGITTATRADRQTDRQTDRRRVLCLRTSVYRALSEE